MSKLEPDAFRQAKDGLNRWLLAAALPLWWERGADRTGGGFFELLSSTGEPIAVDRRARVQARQIYSYAVGGRLGWTGPWLQAMTHGLDYFLDRYKLGSGLFRTKVHSDGSPADNAVWLYDQAFALLAMAEAWHAVPARRVELAAYARAVIEALASRRLQAGGFSEADPVHPYQSNPHMHLLEAALAWSEIDADPVWPMLVDEIVGLALSRFIDGSGALHEFFAEDWSFEASVHGRIVEPGHQFEWAWLLERWARQRDRPDARAAARRLFEIGKTYGVDRARGVAFDQLLDDFSIFQPKARLWPQTERIKASVILAGSAGTPDDKAAYLAEATAAVTGLDLYLNVPIRGLWRDKMEPDGRFIDEPAPASSFYHIVCAIEQLNLG